MAKKKPQKIKLTRPTKDDLRRMCPVPTPEFVKQRLELFYESGTYAKELELIQLFKLYSSNTAPLGVDIKVSEVIAFTKSDVSERVLKQRILESDTFASKLNRGFTTAVDYLIGTTTTAYRYAPFAYSYCYFQKPDLYLPGHWCYSPLQTYFQLDKFVDCSMGQYVQCYADYKKLIKKFQSFYKLQQFTPKELVYFLHTLNQDFVQDKITRRKEYEKALNERSQIRYRFAMKTDHSSQNDLILQILQGKNPANDD